MTPLVPQQVKTILCLGCHSDDIEIGCGGTVFKLLQENPDARVVWAVLSTGNLTRHDEAIASAEAFLAATTKQNILVEGFRDRYFPTQWEAIKDFIHHLAEQFQPDIVFTHRREDMHQDHRLVGELTWNAFRNHLICEYEIPKYEGDLGQPNLYVPLSKEVCTFKVDTLFDAFASQQDKPWFTKETFWSMLRLRGLECHSPSGYAEAFHCRKMVM